MARYLYSVLLAFVIGLQTAAARADPEITIQAGVNYGIVDTLFVGLVDSPEATIDDDFSGFGGRLGLGVAFSERFAFEAGWGRLATNTATTLMFPQPCPGLSCPPVEPELVRVRQRASAHWLAYAPSWRHAELEWRAKLGVARVTVKSLSPGPRPRETDTELLLGIGVGYRLTNEIDLRFDLDRMSGKATVAGIGISYRF